MIDLCTCKLIINSYENIMQIRNGCLIALAVHFHDAGTDLKGEN